MPTFVMIKDREVVDTLKGADPKRLEDMVAKYAPKADPFASASGSGSSDGPAAGDVRSRIATVQLTH